jgi:hypothetical protein
MILHWLRKRKLPAPSQPRNVLPPLPAALVRRGARRLFCNVGLYAGEQH